MPCPPIGPKRFSTGLNCFEQVPIVLNMGQKANFSTEKPFLVPNKAIWTQSNYTLVTQ